jgi:hypothetical protein
MESARYYFCNDDNKEGDFDVDNNYEAVGYKLEVDQEDIQFFRKVEEQNTSEELSPASEGLWPSCLPIDYLYFAVIDVLFILYFGDQCFKVKRNGL